VPILQASTPGLDIRFWLHENFSDKYYLMGFLFTLLSLMLLSLVTLSFYKSVTVKPGDLCNDYKDVYGLLPIKILNEINNVCNDEIIDEYIKTFQHKNSVSMKSNNHLKQRLHRSSKNKYNLEKDISFLINNNSNFFSPQSRKDPLTTIIEENSKEAMSILQLGQSEYSVANSMLISQSDFISKNGKNNTQEPTIEEVIITSENFFENIKFNLFNLGKTKKTLRFCRYCLSIKVNILK
jgi:hypothetical protein